ncbi:MAG: glycosyltransferase family 4 protein [Actinomycetes bacterium]
MSKPPVRVAVVSDAVLPWHQGGKERLYQHLLARWPKQNLDVTVYTMKWWDDAPPGGSIAYEAISRRYAMYKGERRSILQAGMFAISTFKLLWKKYDVIKADQMPFLQLFPLRIVATLRRVPLIVTWYEVWGSEYWRAYLGRAGFIGSYIEHLASKIPSVTVVVSEGSAERLHQMGVPLNKICVLPHVLDRDELSRVIPSTMAPTIMSVGRLMSHKRVDLTLRALQQIPDTTLGIIGTGPEYDRLVQLSEELGVADRVTFFGNVADHDAVLGLVKGATVVSLPSEREGFGMAVAESLGLGTPVVTSHHSDNEAKNLISDGTTGSVIAPGDVSELVAALNFWLAATPRKDTVSNAFWNEHGDLSWDSVATQYANIFMSAVK